MQPKTFDLAMLQRHRNSLAICVLAVTAAAGESWAGELKLAWNPVSSSNLGGYEVFLGTASGKYTKSVKVGNVTTRTITGLTDGGTYYFAVKAYDKTGTKQSGFSNEIRGTVPPVTPVAIPPKANFTAAGVSGKSPLLARFTDTSTGPITSWAWSFGDGTASTLRSPTHTYTNSATTAKSYNVSLTVKTADGKTNTLTRTGLVTVAGVTATTPPAPPPPTSTVSTVRGLVAAYRFDEPAGTISADASGNGNHGTRSGGAIATGRAGRAVELNGSSNWITVPDSASLDLKTAMTLEAWVYPTDVLSGWRCILFKEMSGGGAYYLHANSTLGGNAPASSVFNGAESIVNGGTAVPAGQWTHLASTYDGAMLRLYVNGKQVSSRAVKGAITVSSGVLHIGGNSVWKEYFKGRVDEVRIYNRALSATEIAADIKTPVMNSNPPKVTVGDSRVSSTPDTVAKGTAIAFQATASATRRLNRLAVYLDAATTATQAVVGLYSDASGRPGQLMASGRLTVGTASNWYAITTPAVALGSGQKYWLSVVGVDGNVVLRSGLTVGGKPSELNAQKGLTALPATWGTGTRGLEGPYAVYGAGY